MPVVRSIVVVTRSSAVPVRDRFTSILPDLAWTAKATMMTNYARMGRKTTSIALTVAAGICLISSAGCQVSLNGQTLPSPYYLQDDVQYFPSGPEFKLAREAAALKAATAEEKKNRN